MGIGQSSGGGSSKGGQATPMQQQVAPQQMGGAPAGFGVMREYDGPMQQPMMQPGQPLQQPMMPPMQQPMMPPQPSPAEMERMQSLQQAFENTDAYRNYRNMPLEQQRAMTSNPFTNVPEYQAFQSASDAMNQQMQQRQQQYAMQQQQAQQQMMQELMMLRQQAAMRQAPVGDQTTIAQRIVPQVAQPIVPQVAQPVVPAPQALSPAVRRPTPIRRSGLEALMARRRQR